MTNKELIMLRYDDGDFLIADGFDDAIIGFDEQNWKIVYSVRKCIDILMNDMSEIDAMEYFAYNVSGGYVGEMTPIWNYDLDMN